MKLKKKSILACSTAILLLATSPLMEKVGRKGLNYLYSVILQPDVMIYGPILMADGIGRQTVELAQVLAEKSRVHILSHYVNKKDLPTSIKAMLQIKYKKKAPIAIVEECLWFPGNPLDRFFSTTEDPGQIRYAYSMFESTQIMPEWVMMLNLYFDAVIVPDPYLIGVYANSGVTIPVFHIPLGIDIREFLAAPIKEAKKKGPFVFASLGKAEDRKNHILTIQAFAKALGNNPNALLYVNCRAGEQDFKSEIKHEISKLNCNNIKFTEVCLRKDAYLKFFRAVDCLLHFSKGEGFAIQPREAMSLGIPVILANNTAQTTICDSGLVKTVSSNMPQPAYYGERVVGQQFNCDLDECAAAILDVYLNYNKYLEKGPAMRAWASQYDYQNISSQYKSLISPKEVIYGDDNIITDQCIYTNSKSLYEKYKNVHGDSAQYKNLAINVFGKKVSFDLILGKNKSEIEKQICQFPLDKYRIYTTEDNELFYCDEINDAIKNVIRRGISWESHIRKQMQHYVVPGSTVLDIGAHIGTHTITLSKAVGMKEGGRVIAFEPQPKLFRELFMNMNLNNIKNVELLSAAVGDHEGEIELSPLNTHNEGGTGLTGGTGHFVPLMTVDSLKLENVSLIKVDVEGLEDRVLAGMKETVLKNKPAIFIEIMGGCDVDTTTAELRQKIKTTIQTIVAMGYSIQRLGEADYLALPLANEGAL